MLRSQFNWVFPVAAFWLIEVLVPNKSPIKKANSCWGFWLWLTAGAGTIALAGAGTIALAGAGTIALAGAG